jgi:hypothetical protein
MCTKILNSIGLILSIIGSVFWFKWGLSQTSESFGIELGTKNQVDTKWGRITVEEAKKKGNEEMARCRNLARFGLFLIALGFAFQLVATWI